MAEDRDDLPEATIHIGDCIESMRRMPDASVHCCVTSPPYWGLRDYGVDGQLGLEPTPEEYVEKMVDIFRDVRRVLRNDGTLWLNLGDSYVGANNTDIGGNANFGSAAGVSAASRGSKAERTGLRPKNLVGIPWRVAFALQADGWYLRSDIIWSKPNPMPESVTDRPTKAHEYIFLLSKAERYFYDHEAIKEDAVGCSESAGRFMRDDSQRGVSLVPGNHPTHRSDRPDVSYNGATRNRRTVWEIATKPFPEAHFAVYPPTLIEPCILAGTSAKGCCAACGAPWERVVEKELVPNPGGGGKWADAPGAVVSETSVFRTGMSYQAKTTGWQATCACNADPVPCTILDPFGGAGTTALVALAKGRNAILCELNPEYAEMARQRVQNDAPMFNQVSIAA